MTEETYERSLMLLQCTTARGLSRIIYIETYSGPYDTAGVLYSELINTWLDGTEREKKVNEILQTATNFVQVSRNNQ